METDAIKQETKMQVQINHYYKTKMPHSEVCIHMRVAGQNMIVQPISLNSAQLYRINEKNQLFPFSGPITNGEAGILYDEFNNLYIPDYNEPLEFIPR